MYKRKTFTTPTLSHALDPDIATDKTEENEPQCDRDFSCQDLVSVGDLIASKRPEKKRLGAALTLIQSAKNSHPISAPFKRPTISFKKTAAPQLFQTSKISTASAPACHLHVLQTDAIHLPPSSASLPRIRRKINNGISALQGPPMHLNPFDDEGEAGAGEAPVGPVVAVIAENKNSPKALGADADKRCDRSSPDSASPRIDPTAKPTRDCPRDCQPNKHDQEQDPSYVSELLSKPSLASQLSPMASISVQGARVGLPLASSSTPISDIECPDPDELQPAEVAAKDASRQCAGVLPLLSEMISAVVRSGIMQSARCIPPAARLRAQDFGRRTSAQAVQSALVPRKIQIPNNDDAFGGVFHRGFRGVEFIAMNALDDCGASAERKKINDDARLSM